MTVNGKVVTALGSRAIPGVDHIKLRGKLIHGDRRLEYYLFNKPTGCVTTMQDPEKRFCVGDVVRAMNRSVVPVGRLDYASSGLLLLTNDGVLAQKLTHARAQIERTYHAKLSAVPSEAVLERLRRKVFLADGPAHAVRVRKLRSDGNKAWVEIVIAEGRNRQVRRMFEAVGILVEKLRRTKMGPLTLGRLATGDARRLEQSEIDELRAVTGRKS